MNIPLHSNLVIFQCYRSKTWSRYRSSLHSNLVIFQSSLRLFILPSEFCLYIPIWLYSNGLISAISRTPFDFTFQSGYIPIMLKQIPIVRIHTLYIPIWLYSNGTAFSLSISIIYPLHSNLVIFQLAIAVSPLLYLTSFTFQSGYIPMVGMIGKRRILKDFTFQSGYIPMC